MRSWFQRLAEVPNINYLGSPGVERLCLPGHDAKATVHRFTFDGKRSESLSWKTPDGVDIACPAISWQTTPRPDEIPVQTSLRQVRERVELPGELTSYHFAIQQGIEELWSHRSQASWVLEEMEKLCWLDIRLITRSLKKFQREDGSLLVTYAFDRLVTLFEREGYIREALELAEFAIMLGASERVAEKLKERVAVLDEEAV